MAATVTPRRMVGFDVEPRIPLDVISRVHDARRMQARVGRTRPLLCRLDVCARLAPLCVDTQTIQPCEVSPGRWSVVGRLVGLTPARGSVVVLAWDVWRGGWRIRREVPVDRIVRIEVEDVR